MRPNTGDRARKIRYDRIFMVLTIIFVIIGGTIWFFAGRIKKKDPVFVLEYGELDIENRFRAIVMRNEKLIMAGSSGEVQYLLNDGDYVDRGAVVISLKPGSEDKEKNIELSEQNVKLDILKLQKELDYIKIDIYNNINNGNYTRSKKLTKEYRAKSETLKKIISSDSGQQSALIADTIGKEGEPELSIISPVGGILSYYIDGFESLINIENLYSLDYKLLEAELVVSDRVSNVRKEMVSAGDKLFKVVDDASYYLLIRLGLNDITTYNSSEKIVVIIGDKVIGAKVVDCFVQSDYAICALALNDAFQGFYTKRHVDCTVAIKDYKGLIMPITAVTKKDGVDGILRVGADNRAEFVPIKLLKIGNENVIIQNRQFLGADNRPIATVELGQKILKHPEKYKIGDIVD